MKYFKKSRARLVFALLITFLCLAFLLVSCKKEEKLTVHYYSDGTSHSTFYTVKGDPNIDKRMEQEGRIFLGWYLDENFEVPLTDLYPEGDEISLYAKWNIIYETDGKLEYYMKEDNTYVALMNPAYFGEELIVPSQRKGYPVTELGILPERHGYSLKRITIPDSVTVIADNTFSQCYNLEEITLPAGLTKIGSNAFKECKALTEINIPSSVESIGKGAFSGCNLIESIDIPRSIRFIGEGAFANCPKLEAVNIPSEYLSDLFEEGWNIGIESIIVYGSDEGVTLETDEYIYYVEGGAAYITKYKGSSKSVSVPEQMDGIYRVLSVKGAFDETGVEEVTLDFIEVLERDCFANCPNLKSLYIGGKAKTVEAGALSGCTALEALKLPFIGKERGLTGGDQSRLGHIFGIVGTVETANELLVPKTLKTVDISDCTFVAQYAFYQCKYIENVIMPKQSAEFKKNAFIGCDGLENVYCDNVYNWIKYSFEAESSSPLSNSANLYFGENLVADFIVPRNLTAIPDYCFDGCKSIESVTFHSDVVDIGKYAFKGCSKIESITLPSGITELKDGVFYGCSSIGKININGITKIGYGAFVGCSNLKSMVIHSKITEMGASAFANCSSLTDVKIEEGIKSLPESVFYACSSLKQLDIPDSVESIGDSAFGKCTSLENFHYNGKITEILSGTFKACESLKSVSLDGITYIGVNAFLECKSLKKVIIPDTVQTIEKYAFKECTDLEEVVFGANVREIKEYTFSGCTSLCKILFSETDFLIYNYAFSDCTALRSVTLPDNLYSVGSYAFANCTRLTTVVYEYWETSIYENAFYNCPLLVEIINPSGADIEIGKTTGEYAPLAANALVVHKDSKSRVFEKDGLLFIKVDGTSCLFGYIGEKQDLVLPEAIDSESYTIREKAFYGNSVITSLFIPGTVSSIGSSAFSLCENLASVSMGDGIQIIPEYLFSECRKLSSVSLPEGLLILGNSAFYKTAITEITMPQSLDTIGTFAFSECSSLKSVTLNSGLYLIESNAFSGTGISHVKIPASVHLIGQDVFDLCEKLTAIEFEDPLNWKRVYEKRLWSPSYNYGNKLDVSDPEANANYFDKHQNLSSSGYWYKHKT